MTTVNEQTASTNPNLLPAFAAAILASAAGVGAANLLSDEGENGSLSSFFLMLPIAIALAAALFLYVLPRTRPEGPARIWLGVLSVAALPAFWSGVPIVLGVATVAAARRAGSVAWAVVGGLAAVAALVVCIVG